MNYGNRHILRLSKPVILLVVTLVLSRTSSGVEQPTHFNLSKRYRNYFSASHPKFVTEVIPQLSRLLVAMHRHHEEQADFGSVKFDDKWYGLDGIPYSVRISGHDESDPLDGYVGDDKRRSGYRISLLPNYKKEDEMSVASAFSRFIPINAAVEFPVYSEEAMYEGERDYSSLQLYVPNPVLGFLLKSDHGFSNNAKVREVTLQEVRHRQPPRTVGELFDLLSLPYVDSDGGIEPLMVNCMAILQHLTPIDAVMAANRLKLVKEFFPDLKLGNDIRMLRAMSDSDTNPSGMGKDAVIASLSRDLESMVYDRWVSAKRVFDDIPEVLKNNLQMDSSNFMEGMFDMQGSRDSVVEFMTWANLALDAISTAPIRREGLEKRAPEMVAILRNMIDSLATFRGIEHGSDKNPYVISLADLEGSGLSFFEDHLLTLSDTVEERSPVRLEMVDWMTLRGHPVMELFRVMQTDRSATEDSGVAPLVSISPGSAMYHFIVERLEQGFRDNLDSESVPEVGSFLTGK